MTTLTERDPSQDPGDAAQAALAAGAAEAENQLILGDDEIALLQDIRELLEKIDKRYSAAAWKATHDHARSPENYGRCAAMADVAADAIFSFLNTTNAYLRREMTSNQIHGSRAT